MNYLIVTHQGQIVLTNISSNNILDEIQKCSNACERVFCMETQKYRRQGKINLSAHYMFVYTTEEMTNKVFKYHLNGIKVIGELIDSNVSSIKEAESQKTRRLKHNLINHNSKILLELYRLVPQDAFRGETNHVTIIEEILRSDVKKAAFAYLKILKSSNLMKAEFEVYEMFNTEDPYLDCTEHQIHKVIILTLNPFWLDLVEKNININIQSSYEKVHIDYKSISVALSHIFDNVSKYIMPNSELKIWFQSDDGNVSLFFEMISLKVEDNEVNKIFRETNSGHWAVTAELNGDGIGMFVIRKLIELNKGEIEFVNNYKSKYSGSINGLPYENNLIIIKLKKALN